MEKLYFVTYATHESGLFKNLINNKYNIKIDVLGFNTKWNGFYDKIRALSKYCKNKPNNSIIVFLDGFDTKINKNPIGLINDFKKFNTNILVSSHPKTLPEYMLFKVFTSCDGENIANSGLFMGYSKDICIMSYKILKLNLSDDQRAMNIVLRDMKFKVDTNNVIFKNYFLKNENEINQPYFTSFPGATKLTIKDKYKRYYRSIFEYYKFFIFEIYVFVLVIILLVLSIKKYQK